MHELTKIVHANKYGLMTQMDSVITSWLTQKAKKINQKLGVCRESTIEEILGVFLKDAECEHRFEDQIQGIHTSWCQKGCGYGLPKPSPAVKDSWCAHCDVNNNTWGGEAGGFASGDIKKLWKFCPICGKPRPTTKTLAQRLYESYVGGMAGHFIKKDWEKVSAEAISYFKSIVESMDAETIGARRFQDAILAKMEEV